MKLKIAIAGTGNVATRNYLPFLSRRDDVELACWNRTPEKAREAARQFGAVHCANLKDLVQWEPDAILVLTSETVRDTVATELITAGARRLYLEKPLVAQDGQAHVTTDDFHRGKTLLDLAQSRGCETAMMFNYRFFKQTIRAGEVVAARDFGEVTQITAQVHYACWSHCIDLIRVFAGEVDEIAALPGTVMRESAGIHAKDVAAVFRMENGAVGTIAGTSGMVFQHPLFELTFTFERGRIHLRDLDGDIEILDGTAGTTEVISLGRDTSRWQSYNDSFEAAVGAYLETLRAGLPPPVSGLDGLRELQFEAALKQSIQDQRPVNLDSAFPI